jgi:hypothetical protein
VGDLVGSVADHALVADEQHIGVVEVAGSRPLLQHGAIVAPVVDDVRQRVPVALDVIVVAPGVSQNHGEHRTW